MSYVSKIEWTDATWNPITGCTPISEGCKNCYAKRMATRLAGRYGYPKDDPFKVTFHPERLEQPLHWKKPSRIFVCSMGDLFHPNVKEKWIGMVLGHIAAEHWHTFQVLTKRPDKALEFCQGIAHYPKGDESQKPISGLPPNLWFGVTIENQKEDKRIYELLKIPAAVRFISVEPMLEPVDISQTVTYWDDPVSGINWVIAGAETGPGARPAKIEWFKDLRDQCKTAGVPFFMKKLSGNEPLPDDLNIREFPNAVV